MNRIQGVLPGLVAIASLLVAACQPAPVECVCKCDGPPPPGTEVTVVQESADSEAKPTAVKSPAPEAAAKPAAAPAPSRAAATPRPARSPRKGAPRRATGRVAAEPGSGVPTSLTDADKAEIKRVLTEFANAAGARNLPEMQKYTTDRLGKSLESAVIKYTDRLYRRTDMFTAGVQKGVTVGETNDIGDGNVDVEFKFGTGDSARLMLFKEEGNWRLNRL